MPRRAECSLLFTLPHKTDMTSLLLRLIADDEGQDLVEYVLLTATVALAALLGIAALGDAINSVYTAWDAETQDLWEPQAPAAS